LDHTEQNFGEGPDPGRADHHITFRQSFQYIFSEAGFGCESLIKIRMTIRITSCWMSRRWASCLGRLLPLLPLASSLVNTVSGAARPPDAVAPSFVRPRSVTRSGSWSCLSWSWCWWSRRRQTLCPSSWPGPGNCTTWPGWTSSPPGPSPGSAGSSTTWSWSCSLSSSLSPSRFLQNFLIRSRHKEAVAGPWLPGERRYWQDQNSGDPRPRRRAESWSMMIYLKICLKS